MGARVNRPGWIDDQTALNICIKNLAILKKTPEQFIENCNDVQPDDPVLIDSVRRISYGMFGATEEDTRSAIIDSHDSLLQNAFRELMLKALVEQKKTRLNRDCLVKIAIMLLDQGADPNAVHPSPIKGYTPLMLAVESNEPELVELMLEKGGNPYRTYQYGANLIDCWRIAREFRADNAFSVLERYRQ
ncbi:ankyrin repeat domain-containing protein [Endozoicomonas acroporae]|uniref:ankyrin repeat domain-containing protein n=1 Tax=Endozoicomonas acroporae TaxID=1701104 RepID=UPI000C770D9C|nr:ankyrin repeat domain-containing protein [Endozoicomonas acroporae]